MTCYQLKAHLVEKIWGGESLARLKGLANGIKIGESWEISSLPEGQSTASGKPLAELIKRPLPYLVKLLETTDHLSVQVHPDDRENEKGKTECWLVLEAGPDAGIFLGFKPKITKNRFQNAIDRGEDISTCLNFYPVKSGDFFYTPAGSVHAIGKNILLLEVQQACGITYRVWDWNRLGDDGKPRSLHVKQAMECLNFNPEHNNEHFFRRSNIENKSGVIPLVSHPDFNFSIIKLGANEIHDLKPNILRPRGVCILQGEIKTKAFLLNQYQSAICLEEQQELRLKAGKMGAVVACVE